MTEKNEEMKKWMLEQTEAYKQALDNHKNKFEATPNLLMEHVKGIGLQGFEDAMKEVMRYIDLESIINVTPEEEFYLDLKELYIKAKKLGIWTEFDDKWLQIRTPYFFNKERSRWDGYGWC